MYHARTVPFAFLLFTLAAGCSPREPAEPILIGQVSPYSGPDKHVGEHVTQGLILAVEEANREDNRILNRRVAVLTPNSQSVESIGKIAIRLVEVNRVAALLGGTGSAQAEGLAPVAQSKHIPVVSTAGLADSAGNEFFFQTGLSPAAQGRALACCASREKFTQAFIIADATRARSAATAAVAEAFIGELKKAGGTVTEQLSFTEPAKLKDKEIAQRIKAKQPSVLFFAGAAADLAELRRTGLEETLPILFAGEEGSLRQLKNDAIPNPVYLATVFAADADVPRTQEFVNRYRQRFGDAPDVHAATTYDNAGLLFQALRQANTKEGDRVRKALADTKNYESLTGPLSFRADRWAVRPAFILRVEKGREKLVQTVEPADG